MAAAELQGRTDDLFRWLAAGELQKILDRHDQAFSPEEIASIQGVNKQTFTAEINDHDELDCPQCEGIRMTHFKYGDTSGIILHKCNQCDGIWTDKDQLDQVEKLAAGWKADLNQDVITYGPLIQKVELQDKAEFGRQTSVNRHWVTNFLLRRFIGTQLDT